MNLDLFNNLINNTKEDNVIQSFIKELGEFLENTKKAPVSIVQKIQDERKLTTEYRDKFNIERNKILNSYAKKTSDKGTMYYVYSKNSKKDDIYNLCICEEGKSHEINTVKENQLPKGAGVASVLREENGKYVLDKEATEEVLEQLTQIADQLLEEQTQQLNAYRIEGHSYEVVENLGDRVFLIDISANNCDCFEEIDFPEDLMEQATEGTIFKYIKGKYQ
ncbi:MAG: hypothetical protein IJE68_03875 [Clostridia bacterium]|nr:hypothetical protein [Clostridia bacterium]